MRSYFLFHQERRKVADYKCNICVFSTLGLRQLTSHLRSVHDKPIICSDPKSDDEEQDDPPAEKDDSFECLDCKAFKVRGIEILVTT